MSRTPRLKGARALVALTCHRNGAAAIEFALIAPVLVLLVIGMVDYGSLIYKSMQVAAAAHAGAQYAVRNGWNAVAIKEAVAASTDLAVTATPAPQLTRACVVGGVLVPTAASICTSGVSSGRYVLVSARSTLNPILRWPSFVMPSKLSSQAMIRIN